MSDQVPEFYADMLEVVGNPYGVVLNFKESPFEQRGTVEPRVRIRMSWEHSKVMIFVMWRHLKQMEQKLGVSYPVPIKVLNDAGIAPDDWDPFWKPTPLMP